MGSDEELVIALASTNTTLRLLVSQGPAPGTSKTEQGAVGLSVNLAESQSTELGNACNRRSQPEGCSSSDEVASDEQIARLLQVFIVQTVVYGKMDSKSACILLIT